MILNGSFSLLRVKVSNQAGHKLEVTGSINSVSALSGETVRGPCVVAVNGHNVLFAQSDHGLPIITLYSLMMRWVR